MPLICTDFFSECPLSVNKSRTHAYYISRRAARRRHVARAARHARPRMPGRVPRRTRGAAPSAGRAARRVIVLLGHTYTLPTQQHPAKALPCLACTARSHATEVPHAKTTSDTIGDVALAPSGAHSRPPSADEVAAAQHPPRLAGPANSPRGGKARAPRPCGGESSRGEQGHRAQRRPSS